MPILIIALTLPAILWLITVGLTRTRPWSSWLNLLGPIIFYGILLSWFVLAGVAQLAGCNLNEGGVNTSCAVGGQLFAEIMQNIMMLFVILAFGGIAIIYAVVILLMTGVLVYRIIQTIRLRKTLQKIQ